MDMVQVRYIGGAFDGASFTHTSHQIRNGAILRKDLREPLDSISENNSAVQSCSVKSLEYECREWRTPKDKITYWVAFYIGEEK